MIRKVGEVGMTEKAFEQMMSGLKEAKNEYAHIVFPDCSAKYYAVRDAIEMLKEQEAVKPILEQDSMVCGECGHEVIWQKMLGDGIWGDEKLDYCPHCGRKVKWDD